MGVTLKVANLWRVIREIDLQAIRAAALSPFELWLVDGPHPEQQSAERLRAHLTADARVPHPSLRIVAATDVATATTTGALPAAAVVIVSERVPSSAIESALNALRRGRVPTVVAVIGGDQRADDRVTTTMEHHVAVAALDEEGVAKIAAALAGIVSADLRLALARQFLPMRPAVFELTIDETAKANASYALTTGLAEVVPVLNAPLNLGDMIVLTKNQLVMSYRLVLASGRDGEPRALIGEILGVLGGGLLFRQLARQLVGLIPVAGLIPKIAIAYGGTWAIGRAIVLWATEGREITSDLVRTLSAEGLQRGRGVAARLVDGARDQSGRTARRWERLKEHLPLVGRRRRLTSRNPPPS